ncbi:uncharacterized protein LOC144172369 [Haemaphysalis longicornis]
MPQVPSNLTRDQILQILGQRGVDSQPQPQFAQHPPSAVLAQKVDQVAEDTTSGFDESDSDEDGDMEANLQQAAAIVDDCARRCGLQFDENVLEVILRKIYKRALDLPLHTSNQCLLGLDEDEEEVQEDLKVGRRSAGDVALSRKCNTFVNTIFGLLVCPAIVITAVFFAVESLTGRHMVVEYLNESEFLQPINQTHSPHGELPEAQYYFWEDPTALEDEPEIPVRLHWMTSAGAHQPRDSVAAVFDGKSLLYAGRADRGGAWTPCLAPRHQARPTCVSSLSSGQAPSSHFQYLLETEGLVLSWLSAGRGGALPENAVRADPAALGGDTIVFARQLRYEDQGLPSGGLLSSARRMLAGPDGVVRPISGALQILTKRRDTFPNERWLPAVLPEIPPLWPAKIAGQTTAWLVGRTVRRGDTLPCYGDKRGCLAADWATRRCLFVPTFEYLAQSMGTSYAWQVLARQLPIFDPPSWLRKAANGTTRAPVSGGRGAADKKLLAAKARSYGALVVGYIAVHRSGSIDEDEGVIGCSLSAGDGAPVITAQHDVQVLMKFPSA